MAAFQVRPGIRSPLGEKNHDSSTQRSWKPPQQRFQCDRRVIADHLGDVGVAGCGVARLCPSKGLDEAQSISSAPSRFVAVGVPSE